MTDAGSNVALSAGSVWRRWEPHVHLPGTLFNDQFGRTTIEQALDALAACEPRIEAVGVTDYFTTESYREAVTAHEAGAGVGISFLFPNVELRLDIQVASGSGVNLHLLAKSEDVDLLEDFLGRLHFSYQDQAYSAGRTGLIRLGRAILGNQQADEATAMREGAKQFKVSFPQLRTAFKEDRAATEKLIVCLAGGESDGSSGVRADDGGFVALRQSLERFSHVIFSGSPQQTEFWLGCGADPPDKIARLYGGLKPCMHGSDAHRTEDLGYPQLDRFTWLKGDANFETLRLACLAPETRARIASTSPASGTDTGRLSSVSVVGTDWFVPEEVPINPGLVAIIGARGSGKTALADIAAVGAGDSKPFDNPSSFVVRAGALLTETTATVGWYGQKATVGGLATDPWSSDESIDETRVRYLTQQFVERLCASDGISDELRDEIERVIYDSWPVEERQGAGSFRELLDIRLGTSRDEQTAELEVIGQIGDRLTDLRVQARNLPGQQAELKKLQESKTQTETQISNLTKTAGADHAERYALVNRVLGDRQGLVQSLDRQITDLTSLRSAAAKAQTSQFPEFVANLKRRYPYTGLADPEWEMFLPTFSGDVTALVGPRLGEIQANRQAIAGESLAGVPQPLSELVEEQLQTCTVAELQAERDRLQALVGLDTQRSEQLRRFQDQLNETTIRITSIETTIEEAGRAPAKAEELAGERASHYSAYFDAILTEAHELAELYAPLRQVLEAAGTSVQKLNFTVKRSVDLAQWVEQGESLIDLRVNGAFRGNGELEQKARETLLDAWATGNGDAAAEAIQAFAAVYDEGLRAQSRARQSDEAARRRWEREVTEWLYSVDHIKLVYGLEYGGVDVKRLSPGTRGIVLLLLYLAVDRTETIPLIVDQPEENLDPESVQKELVEMFREASARRQVIMITHNANLVVNSDADQVIVAHSGNVREGKLPKFTYSGGGLEEPHVRKAVCDILEGGEDAFRQRARRLHIDASSALLVQET
jgi:AAA domain, putative AbiEii toxin, Type IV TA system